jgi:hypothetical protein
MESNSYFRLIGDQLEGGNKDYRLMLSIRLIRSEGIISIVTAPNLRPERLV